ncbi:hypothetical protein AB0C58_23675, partial [Streptomyces parvulus]
MTPPTWRCAATRSAAGPDGGRSAPDRVRHGVEHLPALALTVLMIGLVGRVHAHYGLSVLGIG